MAVQQYKGILGSFEYDDTQFEVRKGNFVIRDCNATSIDCSLNVKYPERLVYIGKETDGSKIHIPDGILAIRGMFHASNIVSPPVIPKGVVDCTGAFFMCDRLQSTPIIPYGAKYCSSMFEYCSRLSTVQPLPTSLQCCNSMFASCLSLVDKGIPAVPLSVSEYADMFFRIPGNSEGEWALKHRGVKPYASMDVDEMQSYNEELVNALPPRYSNSAYGGSFRGYDFYCLASTAVELYKSSGRNAVYGALLDSIAKQLKKGSANCDFLDNLCREVASTTAAYEAQANIQSRIAAFQKFKARAAKKAAASPGPEIPDNPGASDFGGNSSVATLQTQTQPDVIVAEDEDDGFSR